MNHNKALLASLWVMSEKNVTLLNPEIMKRQSSDPKLKAAAIAVIFGSKACVRRVRVLVLVHVCV